MNFNIYIDDKLSEKLTEVAKTSNKSRDEIIEEAISLWLKVNEKPEWPDEVLAFKGLPDLPVFESHRDDFFDLEDQVTPDFMTERVEPPSQERELF